VFWPPALFIPAARREVRAPGQSALTTAAIRTKVLASALQQQNTEVVSMNSNYVFLCGVMWCAYGDQEAGEELLRATSSLDPDTRSLAWALLENGMKNLRKKVIGTPGRDLGHSQSRQTHSVM
jgi:hypothetical protein